MIFDFEATLVFSNKECHLRNSENNIKYLNTLNNNAAMNQLEESILDGSSVRHSAYLVGSLSPSVLYNKH